MRFGKPVMHLFGTNRKVATVMRKRRIGLKAGKGRYEIVIGCEVISDRKGCSGMCKQNDKAEIFHGRISGYIVSGVGRFSLPKLRVGARAFAKARATVHPLST